jgi:hypothetical protein
MLRISFPIVATDYTNPHARWVIHCMALAAG